MTNFSTDRGILQERSHCITTTYSHWTRKSFHPGYLPKRFHWFQIRESQYASRCTKEPETELGADK